MPEKLWQKAALAAALVLTAALLVGLVRGRGRDREAGGVALELPTPRGPGAGLGRPPRFTGGGPEGKTSGKAGGPGKHFAFYQGRSGALAEGLVPSAAEPTTRLGAPGRDPEMEVWVPNVRVLARGTEVFARLHDPDPTARIVLTSVRVGFSAHPRELPSATLTMAEAAVGLTRAAARGTDLTFSHHFTPPAAPPAARATPPRFFRYHVVLSGTRNGTAFERQAGGFFYVHDPGATLAPGSAKVGRDGDDLLLTVDANVTRAGTYFVYAELWGGPEGQRGVAFARDRLVGVAPGARTLTLRFGGRIVRDAGVDGPYVVRNVRLVGVDTHPGQEADPLRELPPTPPMRAADFP